MSQPDQERGEGVAGPRAARFISVFALGCGAGMRFRGPLARQITDEIADALSAFPTLIAQPQHLVEAPAAGVDPTLTEEEVAGLDESGPTPRLRFILFSTLPSDAMVRELTRAAGGRLALSGRMVMEGGGVDLALNLWDVEPPNLLWCRLLYGETDELPEMVADAVGHLAHRLEAPGTEDVDAAVALARARIGTGSFAALTAFASVTENFRQAALDARLELRHGEISEGLVSTINLDPAWESPRLLLLEHALDRLGQGDRAYAAALLSALGRLESERLVYDLLRFEALICLGQEGEAREVLADIEARHPGDPRLAMARDRLR